jgi:teichuronic acid biosynthesis glycosyltransferase TuaH
MELKNMPENILHVIVGGPKLENDSIKYRRRRFAEYLCRQPSTSSVFWVYADNNETFGRYSFPEIPENSERYVKEKMTPVAIGDTRFLAANNEKLQQRILKPLIRLLEETTAFKKILWFSVPRYSALGSLYQWDKIVYDCSDYWVGQYETPGLINTFLRGRVHNSEKSIVRHSDILFSSSNYLNIWLEKEYQKSSHVVENGVDFSFFSSQNKNFSRQVTHLSGPKLGFVGAMHSYKIDFKLLYKVAQKREDWNFVLIGPLTAQRKNIPMFEELLMLKNVYYAGAVSPEKVPDYMLSLDIGLLPYREADFNLGVFPLKFFEYLASDLTVVGCGLPSTESYKEQGVYHYSEASPDRFIQACEEALKVMDRFPGRKQHIASQADWNNKFEKICSLVPEASFEEEKWG